MPPADDPLARPDDRPVPDPPAADDAPATRFGETTRAAAPDAPADTGTVVIGEPCGEPAVAVPRRIGKYEIVALLGRGGMGAVYRARHPNLRTDVALKVLLAGADASAEELARFRREAMAAARLRHPGIVAVHDLGDEEGKPWIAMELVEGDSLELVLGAPAKFGLVPGRGRGDRPGLEAATAVRFTRELAEAVQAAHEAGVIHRDLKPDNVLRERSGRLKVTDFGLARLADAGAADAAGRTRTGMVMGTPAYMSPEQAAGLMGQVDARSDVYQLGAILYELLTGRPPYGGDTAMEIARRVVEEDPVPPRGLDPSIPRDFETVWAKAMARDPAKRYGSARELAEDCARLLAGEPIRARRERAWERVFRGLRRRPWLLAIAATLLLGAAAVAWGMLEKRRAERQASATQDKLRGLLEHLGRTVDGLEDRLMTLETTPEVRAALAEQSLQILEGMLREDPGFGPAWSYRGKVRTLGVPRNAPIPTEAEADLDAGCARAPGRAVVWYLRGLHHLQVYQRSRGLPWGTLGASAGFLPMPEESGEQRRHREQGLADLDRMAELGGRDPLFGETEARLGRAIVAVHGDDDAERRRALELVEGLPGPRAARLRGQALYLLKRFDEATVALGEALREWPQDAESLRHRGTARHATAILAAARGNDPRPALREALADFDASLRIEPGAADRHNARGILHLSLAEAEAERGGDPREECRSALAELDEAIRREPTVAALVINRGNARMTLGAAEAARGGDARDSFRAAIADFDQGIRRDPDSALAHNNRAIAFQSLGEAESARGVDPRETFRKALADLDEADRSGFDPGLVAGNRASVHRYLGDAEAACGNDPRASYRAAIAECETALRHRPDALAALLQRGNAWRCLGEADASRGGDPRESYARALADYDELLRRHPNHAVAWRNRGIAHRALGAAEAAAGKDPRDSFRRAIADYDEALRCNPGDAAVHGNLANALLGLGDVQAAHGEDPRETFRAAIAAGDRALKRNPTLTAAWRNRGLAAQHLADAEAARGGDPRPLLDRALADFAEALARNPGAARVHGDRGNARVRLADADSAVGGDPRETLLRAIADHDEALRLNPGDADLWADRGLAHGKLGYAQAARSEDPREAFGHSIADFGESLQRNPEETVVYRNRGLIRLALGDAERVRNLDPRAAWRGAAEDAGEALRRRPDDGMAWNDRGNAHRLLGLTAQSRGEDPRERFRMAESDYRTAAERGFPRAWSNLAVLYRILGRWDDGIAALESFARAFPAEAGQARARIEELRGLKAHGK